VPSAERRWEQEGENDWGYGRDAGKHIKEDIVMGFAINHNVSSINALGSLDITTVSINKSLQKLSTGLRINMAADDASGLAISEKFRAQINGLQTAKMNAQEGISMLQTAEGSLNEVSNILQRIGTLATRSANDVTLTNSDRTTMNNEVIGLKAELDRISTSLTFNTKVLLDGNLSGDLQVGAASSGDNQINVAIGGCSAALLSLTTTVIDTSANAKLAIDAVNSAIDTVDTTRGNIGVVQNRLEHTITNLNVSITNTTASESAIRDTDMASEISNYTRLQILQQSGLSMLAQANAQPQSVLSLLK
jgi:flagellin